MLIKSGSALTSYMQMERHLLAGESYIIGTIFNVSQKLHGVTFKQNGKSYSNKKVKNILIRKLQKYLGVFRFSFQESQGSIVNLRPNPSIKRDALKNFLY
jgi:hypothetical protein